MANEISLPGVREPIVTPDGRATTSFYRYLVLIGSQRITDLQVTVDAQATTIATMQADIEDLKVAISSIRDVALFNSLTHAEEIPDLGRL